MKFPGKLGVTFFRLAEKPYDIKQSASMRGKTKQRDYWHIYAGYNMG